MGSVDARGQGLGRGKRANPIVFARAELIARAHEGSFARLPIRFQLTEKVGRLPQSRFFGVSLYLRATDRDRNFGRLDAIPRQISGSKDG